MKQKIKRMLELQVEANKIVHPEWEKQGFEWYRAIYMELMELIEHVGWKWWKKQAPDLSQVKLEVVDIWHFGLSLELEANDGLVGHIPNYLATLLNEDDDSEERELIDIAESFMHFMLSKNKTFPVWMFMDLMAAVGMTFDDLYKLYIGKNVLNNFRQENGYSDGSYVKIWGELEDNQVLTDIMAPLDPNSPELEGSIMSALEIAYKPVKV